jgi:serine/threonine protein phosphatase PrpC
MDCSHITMPGSRDYNEDAVLALRRGGEYCFVVADGLGGHGKGEIASAIAVETFKRNFEAANIPADSFISETFLEAQYDILQEQKILHATSEMKTTCVVLTISDGIARIGHVGDTRAYVFQRNKVKHQTLDHSVPQMLAVSGKIKERNIRNHPDRNRLLRVMGINWDGPKYELSEEFPLTDCQAFLLCCDGFWELCTEKKMCAFLKKSTTAEQWLRLMTEEVERNGQGKDMDNYTAIAVLR